jgi:hypothetical protein
MILNYYQTKHTLENTIPKVIISTDLKYSIEVGKVPRKKFIILSKLQTNIIMMKKLKR